MKKILLGLLIVALVLGLTACSPESYKELAEKMGGMKDNVFGIEANMAEVDKATATVSNSVSVQVDEEGNATATIKFEDAAKIMDSVAKVKGSDQKEDKLKEDLKKPVVDTSSMTDDQAAAQNAAVQLALQEQTQNLATTVEQQKADAVAAGATEEQIAILDTVLDTIASVQANISAEPTMAELATVAVLTEMANTVQEVATADTSTYYSTESGLTTEGQAVAETALSSLDTLKMTSEVAGLELVDNKLIEDLLGSFLGGSKGLSLSSEEQAILSGFSKPVRMIVELITDDGEFSESKYNSFIAQSKAVMLSYDLLSSVYAKPKNIDDCDKLLNVKTKHGLTPDDLIRYVVAMTFVTVDREGGKEALKNFINTGDVCAALMNIGENYEVLANAEVDGFGDVWTSLEKTLKPDENGNYDSYALRCISTLAILIVDSGCSEYLKLGNESGTISGYLNQL